LIVRPQVADVKDIVAQQGDQPKPPSQVVFDALANAFFAVRRARSDLSIRLPCFSRFEPRNNPTTLFSLI
jgi:hypothetical protein